MLLYPASIWMRNIQLALLGSFVAFAGAWWQDGDKIQLGGFLQGYSSLVWGVIVLQAVGGLVVAAVLKYADNIAKCFGNALSIVLSCLLSAILLKEFEPDSVFVLGTLLVLAATFVYSLGIPEGVHAVVANLMFRRRGTPPGAAPLESLPGRIPQIEAGARRKCLRHFCGLRARMRSVACWR